MKKKLLLLLLLVATLFASAQNVGVGTTTPLQKLHVEGASFLNGNVGIGANVPAFPLSFAPALGDKISLWSNSTNSYGFGIQSGLLQIYTDVSSADIAFGYGSSNLFTEAMRIRGNGNVGIGTNTPAEKLHVQGTTYLNGNVGIGQATPMFPLTFNGNVGDKISLWTDGSATHYGFGIQGGLLQMFSKTVQDDIAFGYGSSSAFTETMRIKGNGNVGIGNSNPAYQLDLGNRMRIRSGGNNSLSAGLWLNNNVNTETAFIGMENDTHIGFYGIGTGWKFGMNTQTGALRINGSEGLAGQVITSNGSASTAWDFPVKTYQWGVPSQYDFVSATEVTLVSQNVTTSVNSSLIISAQLGLFTTFCVGCSAAQGNAYIYVNGSKVAEFFINVTPASVHENSLSNYVINVPAGTHSIQLTVRKVSGPAFDIYGQNTAGAQMSFVSVVAINR